MSIRFPLWVRLFLTFAAISVVGVVALTYTQRRNFQHDFLAYVNQQATARVESAAVELGRRYVQVGDWSFLVGRPRLFDSYIEGSRTSADVDGGEGLPPRKGRPPREGPPRDGPPGEGPPPPRGDLLDRPPPEDRPSFADAPDDRRPPRRAARQTRIDALNLPTRVALLDDRDRVVIGNPAVPNDSPRVPIQVNGRVVGNLLLAPQPALTDDIDVAFVRSQTQHAFRAAAGILILALIAALLLARWLLAPVKVLGQRMEELAAGKLDARMTGDRTDELGELARNYNRLAETLSKNQDARRQWGADIAHELRTPLSILRGEIQAMQDGVRPMSKEALDSLQAECARLTALVEDLYQLALSDAGALTYRFEIVDMNTLVRDAENDHVRSLREAGLVLTTLLGAEPLMVRADAQRLSQLLSNLLINAERYTDAPGNVRMTVAERRVGATRWVDVIVDDSPPGVPVELLPKLFERLFRVETSRNRAAGGAGLGLSICKNIAEAHNGTLSASASPLGGLRLTLSLPAANAS